jgi:hypothetical protein
MQILREEGLSGERWRQVSTVSEGSIPASSRPLRRNWHQAVAIGLDRFFLIRRTTKDLRASQEGEFTQKRWQISYLTPYTTLVQTVDCHEGCQRLACHCLSHCSNRVPVVNNTVNPAHSPGDDKNKTDRIVVVIWCRQYIQRDQPLYSSSNVGPESKYTFAVLNNLAAAQLAVSVNPVHKGDGDFANGIAERTSSSNHFHLEYVTLGLGY